MLLTAVYKTVLLISLALIEIEKVSLCHSIVCLHRTLRTRSFLFLLSLLAQIFQSNSLIRYLLSAQEEPFCSLQGGGWSFHPCISSPLKNMPRVFPETENDLLLLLHFFSVTPLYQTLGGTGNPLCYYIKCNCDWNQPLWEGLTASLRRQLVESSSSWPSNGHAARRHDFWGCWVITREHMEIMAEIVSWVDTVFLTALPVTDSRYAPFFFKKKSGNSLEMCWPCKQL